MTFESEYGSSKTSDFYLHREHLARDRDDEGLLGFRHAACLLRLMGCRSYRFPTRVEMERTAMLTEVQSPKRVIAATVVVAALAGCGSSLPADSGFSSVPERDAYSRCQKWAQEGRSQQDVGALIGTYIAANSFSAAEQDKVTSACAKGFVDGGG